VRNKPVKQELAEVVKLYVLCIVVVILLLAECRWQHYVSDESFQWSGTFHRSI